MEALENPQQPEEPVFPPIAFSYEMAGRNSDIRIREVRAILLGIVRKVNEGASRSSEEMLDAFPQFGEVQVLVEIDPLDFRFMIVVSFSTDDPTLLPEGFTNAQMTTRLGSGSTRGEWIIEQQVRSVNPLREQNLSGRVAIPLGEPQSDRMLVALKDLYDMGFDLEGQQFHQDETLDLMLPQQQASHAIVPIDSYVLGLRSFVQLQKVMNKLRTEYNVGNMLKVEALSPEARMAAIFPQYGEMSITVIYEPRADVRKFFVQIGYSQDSEALVTSIESSSMDGEWVFEQRRIIEGMAVTNKGVFAVPPDSVYDRVLRDTVHKMYRYCLSRSWGRG